MPRLLQLLRRPAIRMGSVDNRTFPTSRLRNAQFVSYLGSVDICVRHTDRHDSALRWRKVLRRLGVLALAGGATWVVVESAKALTVF